MPQNWLKRRNWSNKRALNARLRTTPVDSKSKMTKKL